MSIPELVHGERETLSDVQKQQIALVSGRAYPEIADRIAEYMGITRDPVEFKDFPSGELKPQYQESIRGRDVFVVQSHFHKPEFDINRAIIEHVLMIDSAKRAGARSVTMVAPHMAYQRQDRKAGGREPISAASMFGRIFGAAHQYIVLDLHSQQVQGTVTDEKPVVTLTALNDLVSPVRGEISNSQHDDWIVVATDAGSAPLAEDWASELELDMLGLTKVRSRGSSSAIKDTDLVIPDLDGRSIIIVDDMIDTGGTVARSVEKIKAKGAGKVILAATHGLFSGDALNTLEKSKIEKIFVTDTIPVDEAKAELGDKLHVVDIAPAIGEGIVRAVTGGSISALYKNRNHR